MDNYDYLNQISQDNRPVRAPINIGGFGLKKIIMILLAGIAAFILIMIIGNILQSGRSSDSTELIKQIHTRSANVHSVNQDYVRYIKSSQLRSISAAVAGTCLDAQTRLSNYLAIASGDTRNAVNATTLTDEKLIAEEEENKTELSQKLENARLNGILDRSYANYMGLQIALLMAQVANLRARTDEETLISVLDTYYSSLSTIRQSFDNYFNPAD